MAKMISVSTGSDLAPLTALCIQRAKRGAEGEAHTAVHLLARRPESGESALYVVERIEARQGAGNGTTLHLIRVAGGGFPTRASVTNRAPAPCDLEMLSESDALGFLRAVESETVPVALNAPAPVERASKPRASAPSAPPAVLVSSEALSEVAERLRAQVLRDLGVSVAPVAAAPVAEAPVAEASAPEAADSAPETFEGESIALDE